MASLNWLSDPNRYQLVNPAVRVGCAVWLEGLSFTEPPDEFVVDTVWSPSLRPVRRALGKPEQEFRTRVRCRGTGTDRESERALHLLPEWGRRRFVFRDDRGWESPVLRVTRRTVPTTIGVGAPPVSATLAEGPGGTGLGKLEVDLSKALSVQTKVSAAIDPTVTVSLVTGHLLAPAWGDLVSRDSGLDGSATTNWLLQALEPESPTRADAMDFLRAVEASGLGTEHDDVDSALAIRDILRDHPFAVHDARHRGSKEEVAAAREYAVLLGEWGLQGLDLLAETYAELRSSPTSTTFPDSDDPQGTAAVAELGDGEEADLRFTLVGLAPDVTRFAVRVTTEVDGLPETDYSDIVCVAERQGDLVWWEDPDHMTVVEGQGIAVV